MAIVEYAYKAGYEDAIVISRNKKLSVGDLRRGLKEGLKNAREIFKKKNSEFFDEE